MAARDAARGGARERRQAAEAQRGDYEAARLRSEVRGRVEAALLGLAPGRVWGGEGGGGLMGLAAAVVRHGEVSGGCLAEVIPGLLDVLARGLDARAGAGNRDGGSDGREGVQGGDGGTSAGEGADERLACAVALGSLAWRAPVREAMAALAVPAPAAGLPRRTLAQVLADTIRAGYAAAGGGGADLARACAAVAAQLCESEGGWRVCRAAGLSPVDPAVAAHPVLAAVLKGAAAPQPAAAVAPAGVGGSDRAVLAGPSESTSLGAAAAGEAAGGYAERRRWRPHKARQGTGALPGSGKRAK